MRPSRLPLALALALVAPCAGAESLVAAAIIRSQTVVAPEHVVRTEETIPGAVSDPREAIGQEARVTIYPGRPIRAADLGPPALVERNQIVRLVYAGRGLSIETEGRVLDRAAAGERVRVMNLASRSTVTGTVSKAGAILVGAGLP